MDEQQPMQSSVTPVSPAGSHHLRKPFAVALAVVSVLAALEAYAFHAQIWPHNSEPMPSPTPVVQATVTPDPMAGWKTYTNAQYGFQLTFPDGWKGYSVTQQEVTAGEFWRIDFSMKDSGGDDYTIFYIGIYTKAKWDQVVKQGGPASRQFLNENSAYVFTAGGVQSAPTNPALVELANTTTQQILSTFKFTK